MFALIAAAAALGMAAPLPRPIVTADSICRLQITEHAKVVDVIDGDTVRLDDGRQVRLVGIQAPKLALGRKDFSDWPLAAESKSALENLLQGQTVGLGYGGLKIDRNGRVLAHLYVDGTAVWVQGAVVAAGMARVYTWSDNRSCAAELLARERDARAAQRGIWALQFYGIRKPTELENEVDTFQLVEGRVVSAAEVRGRLFMNFGQDYKTDFTVTVASQDVKSFRSAAFNPATMPGKTVRVRGWISLQNGPEIEATHPEQIEFLP